MAETMATVGEMASAIAHNLRNPLASMRSSAEVALEINDTDLWQQNAQDIVVTVDRMEGWIRELLTYARPLAHTPASTALETLLQQAMRRFDDEAQRHKISMVLRLCATLPPVLADAQLLQQAIQSLISNAFEAMPHGGTLIITPRYDVPQRLITVEIGDTGSGIPTEQIDKVLRPFFTTKRRGLGIGLPLAKRIIERHGGSLSLVSTVGQGTTVSVCLPVME